MKQLMGSQGEIPKSVTTECFSSSHKTYRRAEMKNYLMNKIDMVIEDKVKDIDRH